LGAHSEFGKDAPRWTIPSSRRDDTPVIPLPGPGAYDVPTNSDYRRIRHAFGKPQQPEVPEHPTANVDFVYVPMVPEIKRFHIGGRKDTRIGDIIITPGPYFVPKERDTRIRHSIRSRIEPQNRDTAPNLGPGLYDPQLSALTPDRPHSMLGPGERSRWMEDRRCFPGPGAYQTSLKETLKRGPQWTIGRKSRRSRRDKNWIPNQTRNLLAVDQLLIDVDVLPNPAAARQYFVAHPELRAIVRWILNIVYEHKPDEPLMLLERLFESLRGREGSWDVTHY
jgi:hypothetical protein